MSLPHADSRHYARSPGRSTRAAAVRHASSHSGRPDARKLPRALTPALLLALALLLMGAGAVSSAASTYIPTPVTGSKITLQDTFSPRSMGLFIHESGALSARDLLDGTPLWSSDTGGPIVSVTYDQIPSEAAIRTDPLAIPFVVHGNALYTRAPLRSTSPQGAPADPRNGTGETPSAFDGDGAPLFFFTHVSTLLRRKTIEVQGDVDIYVTSSAAIRDYDSCSGQLVDEAAAAGGSSPLAPLLHVVRYDIHVHAYKTGTYAWTLTLSQYRLSERGPTPPLPEAPDSGDRDDDDEAGPQSFSHIVREMGHFDQYSNPNVGNHGASLVVAAKHLARFSGLPEAPQGLTSVELTRRLSSSLIFREDNTTFVSLYSVSAKCNLWTAPVEPADWETAEGSGGARLAYDGRRVLAAYVWLVPKNGGAEPLLSDARRVPIVRIPVLRQRYAGLAAPAADGDSRRTAASALGEDRGRSVARVSGSGLSLIQPYQGGDLVPFLADAAEPWTVDMAAVESEAADRGGGGERYYSRSERRSWWDPAAAVVGARYFQPHGAPDSEGVLLVPTRLPWKPLAASAIHILCLALSVGFLCAGIPQRGRLIQAWAQADRSRTSPDTRVATSVSSAIPSRVGSALLLPRDLRLRSCGSQSTTPTTADSRGWGANDEDGSFDSSRNSRASGQPTRLLTPHERVLRRRANGAGLPASTPPFLTSPSMPLAVSPWQGPLLTATTTPPQQPASVADQLTRILLPAAAPVQREADQATSPAPVPPPSFRKESINVPLTMIVNGALVNTHSADAVNELSLNTTEMPRSSSDPPAALRRTTPAPSGVVSCHREGDGSSFPLTGPGTSPPHNAKENNDDADEDDEHEVTDPSQQLEPVARTPISPQWWLHRHTDDEDDSSDSDSDSEETDTGADTSDDDGGNGRGGGRRGRFLVRDSTGVITEGDDDENDTSAGDARSSSIGDGLTTVSGGGARTRLRRSAENSKEAPAPSDGRLFQQHFKIMEKVGFGAEGSVFCVEHRWMHTKYAIKIIHIHSQEQDKVVQEAVLHSSFDNPNVVRFFFCWVEEVPAAVVEHLQLLDHDDGYDAMSTSNNSECDDWGDATTTEGSSTGMFGGAAGVHRRMTSRASFAAADELWRATPEEAPETYRMLFIQMEYFPRGTLADALRERARSVRLVNLRHILDIADGVLYLHATQNVVHRDLKPTNIFVADSGVLKIGDFGLAKRRGPAGAGAAVNTSGGGPTPLPAGMNTSSSGTAFDLAANVLGGQQEKSVVGGSPLYCSPEQMRGEVTNKPTDVFSLGIIAVEMYCLFTTMHERIRVLSDAREGVLPDEITQQPHYATEAQLFLDMLDADPAKRPAVRKVVRAVRNLVQSLEEDDEDNKDDGVGLVDSSLPSPLARPTGARKMLSPAAVAPPSENEGSPSPGASSSPTAADTTRAATDSNLPGLYPAVEAAD